MNLIDRVQKAREAIDSYPEWARRGCIFQGGGVTRTKINNKNKER